MTLVTVIMPVWRPRADWLREAVTSVLAENSCDIELIVVDDGNDPPIAETLSVDDWRLNFIRTNHRSHYAARNTGLKAATGEYVRFFDADDVVAPGSTGRLLAAAQSAGKDAVAYGWTMVCDERLTPYRLVAGGFEGDVAEHFLLNRFDAYIHGMLCPASVLQRVGPWDDVHYRLMGDRDYVQRIFEQATVCAVNEVVTLYRRHPESITRSARPSDAVQAGLQVLKGYFHRHPDKRGTDLHRAAYRTLHIYRAREFYRLGEQGAALRQLAAAARHDPIAVAALALSLIRKTIAGLVGRGVK